MIQRQQVPTKRRELLAWHRQLSKSERPPKLYWQAMADAIKSVGLDAVTIVVYLRGQDDWISSSWRQDLKAGWIQRTMEDFLREPIVD